MFIHPHIVPRFLVSLYLGFIVNDLPREPKERAEPRRLRAERLVRSLKRQVSDVLLSSSNGNQNVSVVKELSLLLIWV